LTKSFARIHLANLVNFGILPLTFRDAADYDRVSAGDSLKLPDLKKRLVAREPVRVENLSTGASWEMQPVLSDRQLEIILAGGFLNWLKGTLAENRK
jgi:aconitate hydratase